MLARIRLRAQPLESSLGRVPQAADGACKKISKPDRVGRRGLSEPREDFSRLTTYAFPWLEFVALFRRCLRASNRALRQGSQHASTRPTIVSNLDEKPHKFIAITACESKSSLALFDA